MPTKERLKLRCVCADSSCSMMLIISRKRLKNKGVTDAHVHVSTDTSWPKKLAGIIVL